MSFKNEIINKFLDEKKITDKEYLILFSDDIEDYFLSSYGGKVHTRSKEDKNSFREDFVRTLFKVIQLQEDKDSLDLTYIKFHKCNFHSIFNGYNIEKEINFSSAQFKEKTSFKDIKFLEKAIFTNVIFDKNVNLNQASFKKEADFSNVLFKGNTSFKYAQFKDNAIFKNSECEKLFDISDTYFNNLNLDNFFTVKANYLRIHGSDYLWISSKHIETKETARILKTYFEEKKNNIEADKFFAIEMDKYRDEITSNSNPFMAFFLNQDYFVLTLNKFISDFGRDWIRPLLIMFIFGYLSALGYVSFLIENDIESAKALLQSKNRFFFIILGLLFSLLLYLLYIMLDSFFMLISFFIFMMCYIFIIIYFPEFRNINNDISKLVNPLNIFRGKDYFEHIAPYGMLVKLIMSVLIYQFIMAFRQTTRRK